MRKSGTGWNIAPLRSAKRVELVASGIEVSSKDGRTRRLGSSRAAFAFSFGFASAALTHPSAGI
ncbi:MAG TPA: hypothetical protein VFQ61_09160 [Polyangiaceae bacterium]|nr:hypothetical protein [Polyangiaceae bacterium]